MAGAAMSEQQDPGRQAVSRDRSRGS
jgi:hypothetical protein